MKHKKEKALAVPGIEKRVKEPNTLVLLCAMILLCALFTYILPAGVFERVQDPNTNRELVVAGTYQTVDRNPTTFFELFTSIPKGMEGAQAIIFFTLIIGGAFRIINATRAIETSLAAVVRKVAGKETLIIPILIAVFSFAGMSFGVAEETLIFVPMVVSLCLALGFDSITGTAIILTGAGAGFAGGALNPYTVGIAHGITGLPMFSGIEFRVVIGIVITLITIAYVYLYARKVKKTPELSSMFALDQERKKEVHLANASDELPQITIRHKLIILTLFAGIVYIAYGVLKLGFYMTELSAVFLIIAVISGIIGRLSINQMAEEFILGAKDLLYAAVIVGVARALLVVLQSGNILDTVISALSGVIQGVPTAIAAVLMFIVQSFISVIIPSGSGMAAVTMPILAPVGDLVGLTRQTVVLAYQFGDAFSNILTPTCGYFMAAIAMSGISWKKWAKFMLPLFLIWSAVGAIFLVIAVYIQYGPF